MSHRPIIDAGPGLNFFAINRERLLISVLGPLAQQSMADRLKRSKDLGETMVIAHAVVAAEAGAEVTVLIDDGSGARIASAEIRRLARLRVSGRAVGSIRLVNTLTVLERAAGREHIPDRAAMRELYRRLRGLDDGLPPIGTTTLLSTCRWAGPAEGRAGP